MNKSCRLRLQDVRRAFRLIGDCRDLGGDSSAWLLHAFEGVMRLVGGRATIGDELRWPHHQGPIAVVQALTTGFEPRERTLHLEFMHACRPGDHPMAAALQTLPGHLITRTRRQVIDDSAWYRSDCFHEYIKPMGIDHSVNSFCELAATGTINVISVHRAPGERDFSGRERRLLHLFHGELGRLVGTALVASGAGDLAGLSRRLRQTLDCLLEGDGEKRVAARLGLSRLTVHQYVTALCRHFGVASCAELMARFVRRP